jgi:hypothetical protein
MHFDKYPPETIFTRPQLAQASTDCGVPVKPATLSTWASRGNGPPYKKFGKAALYNWGVYVAWALARMDEPASTATEHRANKAHETEAM